MHALHKLLLLHVLTCLGPIALGDEIINGEKAPENSMQYMVSVRNSEDHHVCGGFLISEDFVVTAAHCDCPEGPTHVILGTHNLKRVSHENTREIEERCKHPSYVNVGRGSDIMLLKLSEKVQWDNSVQTIPLPRSAMNIKKDEKCSVAGWGFTRTGGAVVDELRVVNVSFVNLEDCKRKWHHRVFDLPDNVICAGGYGTDKGFCQGDSGGPLVCNGLAVGVVSFNYRRKCDYPDYPNVYTDISKYLPWINRILEGKKCYV